MLTRFMHVIQDIPLRYDKPTFRIIPRLDIKNNNLVKGVHLEGLRVLGDPALFAEYYYNQGADEIFYQDIVASLYERNSLEDVIRRTVKKVFIPITVSGGIRSLEDINNVLKAGADKVAINTAAIKNLEFIKRAVKKFGSSTIAICVEVIKDVSTDKYFCFIDNGRQETGQEVCQWIEKIQSLGIGEIILTSVDKEGTGEGFDEYLLNMTSKIVDVPLIAHGGISGLDNIKHIANRVDGVCVASIFHYDTISKIKTFGDHSHQDGNTRFIKEQKSYGKINPISIKELKQQLAQDIPIRI